MFGCGVTVLHNMVNSSKTFMASYPWKYTNYYTTTKVKKVNCNEKKSRISACNDYDNISNVQRNKQAL